MEGCAGFLLIQVGHPVSGEAEVVQRDGDPKSYQELGRSRTPTPAPTGQTKGQAQPPREGCQAGGEQTRLGTLLSCRETGRSKPSMTPEAAVLKEAPGNESLLSSPIARWGEVRWAQECSRASVRPAVTVGKEGARVSVPVSNGIAEP